jgi:hypothetical protein
MPEIKIDHGQVTEPLIDDELVAFDELIREVIYPALESNSGSISVGDEYFQGLPPLAKEGSVFGIPPEITEARILKQRYTTRPPLLTTPEADSNSNQ